MSEPTDHDPPGWEAIEASLRRQFEPPDMAGLQARVAALAAEGEAEPVEPSVDPVGERRPVEPAELVEPAEPAEPVGWGRGALVVILAVAAAVVLVWSLRGASESRRPDAAGDDAIALSEPAPGLRRAAGRQLDGFLARGDVLPGSLGAGSPSELSCAAHVADTDPLPPPSEACDNDEPRPMLRPGPAGRVSVVGECDVERGVDCGRFDLPAQRALLVALDSSAGGPGDPAAAQRAIVCIEPPWADPKPLLPPGSHYRIFRRTLGTYVLYEITPRPAPLALDHMVLAVP